MVGGLLWQPVKWLARKIQYAQVVAARKKADRLAVITGRKQLVLMMKGRPVVISKQSIKRMVLTHQFNKGVTAKDIEEISIYKTYGHVSDR